MATTDAGEGEGASRLAAVSLWDLTRSTLKRRLQIGGGDARALEFSRTGDELIEICEHHLIILSVPELTALRSYAPNDSISAAATSVATGQIAVCEGFQWAIVAALGQSASRARVNLLSLDTLALTHQCNLRDVSTGVQSAAFHCDHHNLIVGEGNGTVHVVDLRTGRSVFQSQRHGSAVDSLSVSFDGKHLASVSQDQSVRFWELSGLRAVAVLMCLPEDQFAFVLERGYYAASPGGLQAVAFRSGLRVFPAEVYDVARNRPDRVLEEFGYAAPAVVAAYRASWTHRVARLGLHTSLEAADNCIPDVTLRVEPSSRVVRERDVQVHVEATGSGETIAGVTIAVNGCPIALGNDVRRTQRGPHHVGIVATVALDPGRNVIRASAIGASGIAAVPAQVELQCECPVQRGALYLAVIGVSNYASPTLRLQFAAKDANDIARLFAAGTSAFDQVYVEYLLDGQVERDRVLLLREFFLQAGADDAALLFMAGHGHLGRNGSYFFLPASADPAEPERGAITYDDIEGLLSALATRRRAVLIDSCNAGEFDSEIETLLGRSVPARVREGRLAVAELSRSVGRAHPEDAEYKHWLAAEVLAEIYGLFADLRDDSGVIVLAASAGLGLARESELWQNGAFTSAIREAVEQRRASMDNGATVTIRDVHRYVSTRVRSLTAGLQVPHIRRNNPYVSFALLADRVAAERSASNAYEELARSAEEALTGRVMGTWGVHQAILKLTAYLGRPDAEPLREQGEMLLTRLRDYLVPLEPWNGEVAARLNLADLFCIFSNIEPYGAATVSSGLASTAHPRANPDEAARLNIEYQRAFTRWRTMPWWRRLRTRRPSPPEGI